MKTLIIAALSAFLVFGCASEEGGTVKGTVNANCPMMGGEVDPEGGTVDWNGMTVGFCCEGCGEKFEALDDEAKRVALEEAGTDLGD